MTQALAQARKAIAAALLAGASILVSQAQAHGGSLTQNDWIAAVVAAIVAGIGVFYVPNAPATAPLPPAAPKV